MAPGNPPSVNEPKPFAVDSPRAPRAQSPPATAHLLLVGTADTLPELNAIARAAHVDPRSTRTVIASPDAPFSCDTHGVRQAIVCIPESHSTLRAAVMGEFQRVAIPVRLAVAAIDLFAPFTSSDSPPNQWRATPSIDLGDLIGRKPHELDRAALTRVLAGKRVLITGAGGSIGSHLAQVVAEFAPESIILMERSENALFEIDRQLSTRFPEVRRKAILHDVVDADQTMRQMMALSPQIVFHAAAHKHVPLMEDHPAHAVSNNVLGTRAIADAAVACGAERFVMISSDKAVNPASIMGATKRLAELYVKWLGSAQNTTRMSMVRFGNVLGSACSVLTIWSSQISEGGPVTVTDPRMTRYFMTIPEAAALVIASTTLEDHTSGAVYVLDMGDPIRIVDLAHRFVAAHGLYARVRYSTLPTPSFELSAHRLNDSAPHVQNGAPAMDIVFTGARPGEKIHEELAYAAENLTPTEHPGIRAWSGLARTNDGHLHSDAAILSRLAIERMIADLREACATHNHAAVIDAIERHVPEMHRRPRSNAA